MIKMVMPAYSGYFCFTFVQCKKVAIALPSFIQFTVNTDIFDSNVEKIAGGHHVALWDDDTLVRYAPGLCKGLPKLLSNNLIFLSFM